jgi:hypothetical protein
LAPLYISGLFRVYKKMTKVKTVAWKKYVAFTSMERGFRQSMEGLRRRVLTKGDRSIQYRKVGFATAFYQQKVIKNTQ